jgi:hypothetical protein
MPDLSSYSTANAQHIQNGEYLDRRHDEALPDRAPIVAQPWARHGRWTILYNPRCRGCG